MSHASMYAQRRAALAAQLPPNCVALIPASPAKFRTETAEYRYRQHNDFYYLTGFTEKNALLVLMSGTNAESILFCEPKDPDKECWEGERLGPEKAVGALGVSHAYAYSEAAKKLPELLAHHKMVASLPCLNHIPWLKEILNAHNIKEAENLNNLTSAMRLIKSPEELTLMQKAADISVKAHQAGMSSVKPGQYEYQLAALYEFVFAKEGSQAPAYTSIVGGG